ncbi:MAG: TMEM165/GDT1 family protein [Candidatus Cloacimonetes bacterium]|nr:TMEM165/GDT1 family protein [Candidatus Cloacimonadota bacterium]MBS3767584.1 TMEM165/GDT1 family protein [Candidatus Cloacimonadota bacterium]
MHDLLIPFVTIGLAELGDKTQITVFCLASKTKKYIPLLIGVILAFVVVDGLAILLGNFISHQVPTNYLKIISGIVFIIFGIFTLVNNKESEDACELKKPLLSGFWLILVSEMGDKTQIASGLFATKYNSLLVFIAAISSLFLLSILAIFLGRLIFKKLNRKTISYISGIIFIIIGITFLYEPLINLAQTLL